MTSFPDQLELCARFDAAPMPSPPREKVGIALTTLALLPLNGVRHRPENGTCGWYFWAGPETSDDADFFEPLHVEHLAKRLPIVVPYLALPPGWRIQLAPGHEDVWFDESVLRAPEQA